MICFKNWIKTFGEPSEHYVVLPKIIEVLDASAIIDGYGIEEDIPPPPAEEVVVEDNPVDAPPTDGSE